VSPFCATQRGRSRGSAGASGSAGSGGGETGSGGSGGSCSGSSGAVSVGTATLGCGAATGALEELLTLGERGSVARGAAGGGDGLSTGDWAGDAFDPTSVRCGRVRTRERCRPGSGEACGSFLTEPGTMSACGGTSTTDACGSRSTSRAEGEADPMPNTTIAPYRTADPAVAERPSLNWPLGLCLASPMPPLSG
jgi:hypothetical protein